MKDSVSFSYNSRHGFTIVELLIVIVVIAILAAITLVAFNGIQNRARESAQQSAVNQAYKKIMALGVENSETYPLDKAAFLTQTGLIESTDTVYTYTADGVGKAFCVASQGSTGVGSSYAQSSKDGKVVKGSCVRNLATNGGMEAVATSGWIGRNSALLAKVTNESHSGGAAMSVTTPGAVTDEGLNMSAVSGSVGSGLSATHRASAWVKATAGTKLKMFIEEYTSTNSYAAGTTASFTATGAWQKVSISRAVTDSTRKVVFNVRTDEVKAITFYVDDVMINASDTDFAFADGSAQGWFWTGNANASASFGPSPVY